jgi:hypothetical protein
MPEEEIETPPDPTATLAGRLALNEEAYKALPDDVRASTDEARKVIAAAETVVHEKATADRETERQVATAARAVELSNADLLSYQKTWAAKRDSDDEDTKTEFRTHMQDPANHEQWVRAEYLALQEVKDTTVEAAMTKLMTNASLAFADTPFAEHMPAMEDSSAWSQVFAKAKDTSGGYFPWFAKQCEAIGYARGKAEAEEASAAERERDEQQRAGSNGRGDVGAGATAVAGLAGVDLSKPNADQKLWDLGFNKASA